MRSFKTRQSRLYNPDYLMKFYKCPISLESANEFLDDILERKNLLLSIYDIIDFNKLIYIKYEFKSDRNIQIKIDKIESLVALAYERYLRKSCVFELKEYRENE